MGKDGCLCKNLFDKRNALIKHNKVTLDYKEGPKAARRVTSCPPPLQKINSQSDTSSFVINSGVSFFILYWKITW